MGRKGTKQQGIPSPKVGTFPGAIQRYPEPAVGALILNSAGRMLLVKSPKWGERYTIAGGHVEVGEHLVSALKREIKEEVGIRIKDIKLLLVQEALFTPEFWKPRHFIFFDFVCRALDETPRIDGREIQSYSWVEPKRALSMDLDSYTRRMVETFLHPAHEISLSKKSELGLKSASFEALWNDITRFRRVSFSRLATPHTRTRRPRQRSLS